MEKSVESLKPGEAEFRAYLSKRGKISWLARQLGKTPGAVHQWRNVPDKDVRRVAKITGLPLSVLRPDLYPPSRRKR